MRRVVTGLILGSFLLQGCAARTRITSQPSGATVFVDGTPVGETPYYYSDKKIVGSTTSIRLEKPGYKTLNTSINRSEGVHMGALIGGLFVWPLLLWVTDYAPIHDYILSPQGQANSGSAAPAAPAQPSAAPAQPSAAPAQEPQPAPGKPAQGEKPAATSKAERLRELEDLRKQNLITPEEYRTKKKKILDEI